MPSVSGKRVLSPDVLRGVALFGIFQMNVQLFAFPLVGYMRPTLVAPLTGLDLAAWLFTHVFCEFKFISLFSMLFGAGAGQASESELFSLLLHLWRASGCMVLGMALARSGVLAGARPDVERRLLRIGLLVGGPLSVLSAVVLWANDFPQSAALTMGLISYVASLPLALALLDGVLLALRRWPTRCATALANWELRVAPAPAAPFARLREGPRPYQQKGTP